MVTHAVLDTVRSGVVSRIHHIWEAGTKAVSAGPEVRGTQISNPVRFIVLPENFYGSKSWDMNGWNDGEKLR